MELKQCPWCYENFPCSSRCTLTYRGRRDAPIVDGVAFLSPGDFIIVQAPKAEP